MAKYQISNLKSQMIRSRFLTLQICSSIKRSAASNCSEQGFAAKKREVNTARFRSSFISSASSDAGLGFSNQGVIQNSGGIEMRQKTFQIALLAISLLATAAAVSAQRINRPERRELRADRHEIRADTREVRGDRRDIRQDVGERNADVRELRQDRRDGASQEELRADRHEINADTGEIRSDQRELRGDLRDRRGDVRDFRRDRRDARRN